MTVPLPLQGAIVDALLAIPAMAQADAREEVLRGLRREVATAISRHSAPRLDVIGILHACLRYPGALDELTAAVRPFAEGSLAMARLDELVAQAHPYLPPELA